MKLSLEQLKKITSGNTVSNSNILDVCTDSRSAKDGDLFIALKGENLDGHDYVRDAITRGASAALVDRVPDEVPLDKILVVQDVQKAFEDIADYMRSSFSGKVIGVTGSAGKTTVKEDIKYVLSQFDRTFANEKNLNTLIGILLNLCRLDLDARYGVIESGMSRAFELTRNTEYVKPHIAVITNIYPMHIEFFKELRDIALAKAEIFKWIQPEGVAIINADTSYSDLLQSEATRYGIKNILTFGKEGDVSLLGYKECDDKTIVNVNINGREVSYEIFQKGIHRIYNSLCVLAVVESLGLDVEKASLSLKDLKPLEGRGKQYKLKLKDSSFFTLIDDSYSGQPESMRLAVQDLSNMKISGSGRKIAVLGKMGELGSYTEMEHIKLGELLAKSNIDLVIAIGSPMKHAIKMLPKNIKCEYRDNKEGLMEELLNEILKPDDILLVKGSRYGSRVFEVVDGMLKTVNEK